jgi:pyruvoyl-dependent arginine decarboxylase (PvlArgDC)
MGLVRYISGIAICLVMTVSTAAGAWAQADQPKPGADSEAEKILQDSKENDPETAPEVAECIKQWGPHTQMTKEEWAQSCRATLKYFPEEP